VNLLERRQKLLKMRSMGVSLAEAVKDLSERYDVSTRTVYYDWRNRKKWIEAVLGIEDPEAFFLDLVANHGEIYRLASLEYLKGDNSAARIGALRLLRDLNRDMGEMIITRDMFSRVERLEEAAK
jgi:hypothetical protein